MTTRTSESAVILNAANTSVSLGNTLAWLLSAFTFETSEVKYGRENSDARAALQPGSLKLSKNRVVVESSSGTATRATFAPNKVSALLIRLEGTSIVLVDSFASCLPNSSVAGAGRLRIRK
eukprot:3590839-Pleurochrysis_carterae.AAC.1